MGELLRKVKEFLVPIIPSRNEILKTLILALISFSAQLLLKRFLGM